MRSLLSDSIISELDGGGLFVVCKICSNNPQIMSRFNQSFGIFRWNSHCSSKGHENAPKTRSERRQINFQGIRKFLKKTDISSFQLAKIQKVCLVNVLDVFRRNPFLHLFVKYGNSKTIDVYCQCHMGASNEPRMALNKCTKRQIFLKIVASTSSLKMINISKLHVKELDKCVIQTSQFKC